MKNKKQVTNTDAVEISRIDTFSLVKIFTGISSLDYHGDSTHDNARAILEEKAWVAGYVNTTDTFFMETKGWYNHFLR